MTTRTLRLLLAHESARAGAHCQLESLPGFRLVGKTRLGEETVALARTARPHVVVVHLAAAGPAALETLRRLTRDARDARLLVLADHHNDDSVREVLRAGVSAFLSGTVTAAEVRTAAHAVLRGGIYLDATAGKAFIAPCLLQCARRPAGPTPLTARQREVLQLIAEGRSTKQIAARLKISVKTVETHRAHIMQRLDIYEIAGLVRYAICDGLVRPDA